MCLSEKKVFVTYLATSCGLLGKFRLRKVSQQFLYITGTSVKKVKFNSFNNYFCRKYCKKKGLLDKTCRAGLCQQIKYAALLLIKYVKLRRKYVKLCAILKQLLCFGRILSQISQRNYEFNKVNMFYKFGSQCPHFASSILLLLQGISIKYQNFGYLPRI